jgi:hypothetical protein
LFERERFVSVTVNGSVGSETYHAATTSLNYTGTTVIAGPNLALVLTLNFGSGAVTSISCTWDSGGSNQSMTQLVAQSGGQVTSAIFGLRNPIPGNKTLAVSWTGPAEIFAAAICFAGVNPTSDAAAFPHTAQNTSAATVALTSAAGNMVVGCQGSGGAQGTPTGTTIYDDHTSGAVINAQAEYDNGAATVNVGSTVSSIVVVAVDVGAAAGSSFAGEDESAAVSVIPSLSLSAPPVRWPDEESALLAYFYLEQEEPWRPAVEAVSLLAPPLTDEHPLAGYANSPLEDGEPWVVVPSAVRVPPYLVIDDEGLGSPPAFPGDDDTAPPVAFRAVPPLALAQFLDEDGAPLANFPREQEEPALFPVQAISWTARPFLDEDPPGLPLLNFAQEQEEPALFPVETVPWAALPFRDEDPTAPFANFPLEHHEPFVPAVETVPWLARPFTDDEISAGLVFQSVDQEESWPTAYRAFPSVPPAATDDEVFGPAYTIELDEAPQPRTQTVSWLARPSTDDEFLGLLSGLSLDTDDPFVPRGMVLAWTVVPSRDDETGAGLLAFRLEEGEFAAPVRTVSVWAPVLFTDDETGPAPFPGDDDSRPAPQVLALPARPLFVPSEEDAGAHLAGFALAHDEPWQPQVVSLAWTAVPFRDDETSAGLLLGLPELEEACGPAAGSQATPRTVTVPWTARPFSDDEAGAGFAAFALFDDDAPPFRAWVIGPGLIVLDDEISAQLVPVPTLYGRLVFLFGADRSIVALAGVDRSIISIPGSAQG